METTILTLRHAHTQFNVEKRYAGTIDIPINEKGIQDSRIAAKSIAALAVDVIISSNLKRAYQTAQILAGGKIPIVKTKLCAERNFGILEGRTWDDAQKMDPPILFISVGNDLHSVNPRGGEHFEDLWQRAKKFRDFIFRRYSGKTVLVVSHGVFLQMFHGVLRGLSCIEALSVYPANLELATFRFSNTGLIHEQVTRLADSPGINF